MSDSVTTSIEVAVSPDVAFDVFTREIDVWYQVDSDTLPDITRTAAIRFEPQVGGRLLDVHDLATGEGRELGRVTAWHPGRRLAFTDNEGTTVEVSFEPRGTGTRVVLSHQGLDRLAPKRAAALRRAGWSNLIPRYRDHLAANGRPLALAVGSMALVLAIAGGLWLALAPERDQPTFWIWILLLLAALILVSVVEWRLAHRVLPSRWQYSRIKSSVVGLLSLGLLVKAIYRVTEQGGNALGDLVVPVLILLSLWSSQQYGPAQRRSRKRACSAQKAFAQRHPNLLFLSLMAGGLFLALALALGLSAISAEGVVLLTAFFSAAASLYLIAAKRRENRTLGFNPDFYLAVARRVGEQHRRPELLVHRASKHPEYSGWYAYDSDQDESSRDLVTWSLRDLIDQWPEAAPPLREGQGKWKWDQARRSYTRVEPPRHIPKPA